MFKLVKRDLVWAVVEEATGQDVVHVFREGSSYAGSITARGRTPEQLKSFALLFAESANLLEACKMADKLASLLLAGQLQVLSDLQVLLQTVITRATRTENATD